MRRAALYKRSAAFGKIINGASSVREIAGDRADLDDVSMGLAEKRHERLTEADDNKEVGSEN